VIDLILYCVSVVTVCGIPVRCFVGFLTVRTVLHYLFCFFVSSLCVVVAADGAPLSFIATVRLVCILDCFKYMLLRLTLTGTRISSAESELRLRTTEIGASSRVTWTCSTSADCGHASASLACTAILNGVKMQAATELEL
jgi:hypothetical protein